MYEQKKLDKIELDYWSYYKVVVGDLKIQPSEFWKMDFAETMHLITQDQKSDQDRSYMVNAERMRNGAPKEWLLNLL